jgi:hypothetical protein
MDRRLLKGLCLLAIPAITLLGLVVWKMCRLYGPEGALIALGIGAVSVVMALTLTAGISIVSEYF